MTVKALSLQETANTGMTHIIVLTANDLTVTATNTAQSFNAFAIPTGAVIDQVECRLITAFQNTADAAFNSSSLDIGDTGSATRWKTAQDINANGTPITTVFSNTSVGPYAASQFVTLNVNSMTGKALNNINRGELHVLIRVKNFKPIHDGVAPYSPTKA